MIYYHISRFHFHSSSSDQPDSFFFPRIFYSVTLQLQYIQAANQIEIIIM